MQRISQARPDTRPAAAPPPAPRRVRGLRLLRARVLFLLAQLFPAAGAQWGGPEPGWAGRRPRGAQGARRSLSAALKATAQLAAVAAGAAVLLQRQAGHPAWQTAWAEDRTVFLPRALLDPWGSFLHCYGGYVQLVPQLIADVVARFPLRDAAAGFAITGAVAAAGCALFVFHASAGHVRHPGLRALLAASVLLLPLAVIEVANNGVDAQWYLMYALFWALLWRPAGRGGVAAAALVAFLAMASNILNVFYLPLAVARLVALPRREQAVTAGWLAGIAYQLAGIAVRVPAILAPGAAHPLAAPGATASFYGRHVLVAALAGWRLAPRLTAAAGPAGAVAIAAGLLLAGAAWACAVGGTRVRLFLAAATALGLVLTVFPAMIRYWVTLPVRVPLGQVWLPGSRYTVCSVLLIDASAVVAVDAAVRRSRTRPAGRGWRPWPDRYRPAWSRTAWSRTAWSRAAWSRAAWPRAAWSRAAWPRAALFRAGWSRVAPVAAVAVLAAVLSTGWVTSFRYVNMRSTAPLWAQTVARFDRLCRHRAPMARVDLYPAALPQARSPVPCAHADPGVARRPGLALPGTQC